MRNPLFTGVCTALVTPFKDNEINYDMLDRLLERQLEAGVHFVVLSGTTGESPALSDDEKMQLIFHARSTVGNDCLIIAGTGSNNTEHTLTMSEEAVQAGADALLIVSPYYNKGNADGLYRHYSEVAKFVKIPIVVYNVPSRTGMDIPVTVYERLSNIDNVVGVKEATSDITKIAKIRTLCEDDFYIWSGNDDQVVPVIAMGGKGVVSVLSNLYPKETLEMTEAALQGDYEKAARMQSDLIPLINAIFSEVNPIPVKYALKEMGLDCGPCRLPLGTLSVKNRDLLTSLIK